MNKFVNAPKSISFSILKNRNWVLSPSMHKTLNIANSNVKQLSSFLYESLNNSHLGIEVGSVNYIEDSSHFFLKTKALQDFSFIPQFTEDSLTPIFPQSFFQMNLCEGDILISKDSNIGESVVLDRDYPNICLSGAIYRLPIQKHKYYVLAIIKHDIFREQLDFLVPKGATIRHAKKIFLDCLIPIPNHNKDNVIKYVELLTQAIINKEKAIKEKHSQIMQIFDVEISSNQNNHQFVYQIPRLSDILNIGRLDCSHYTYEFKQFQFLITNYSGGYYNFSEDGYDCKRGQNLQISNIGQSIYSDSPHAGFYRLILSKHISQFSSINDCQYLGNPNPLSIINKGDIIFSARGEIGRVYILPYQIHNTITNIDSLVISNSEASLEHSIYNAMFLNYLRVKNMIHRFGITGSGAPSFTKYQIDDILIPNFPLDKQKAIAHLYHNKIDFNYDIDLSNFLNLDDTYNSESGLFEINISLIHLKRRLNKVICDIANDVPVSLSFDFYSHTDF